MMMFLSYLHPTALSSGTSDYNHQSRKHIEEVVRLKMSFLGALKNNVIGDLLGKKLANAYTEIRSDKCHILKQQPLICEWKLNKILREQCPAPAF